MFQVQEPMEEANKERSNPTPPMLAEPRPERADGAVEKLLVVPEHQQALF
jgi:hypothetical protein